MIQSVMLVALGFLLASLLTIFIAPAFWSRAVRLTTDRIKSSLPVSETEIRADKDQLRAQYAVRVHQLEMEIEESKLKAARQLIELNRRDASITEFEAAATRLQSELEENQNARHVLEQTINDRLPRLESRLGEARRLLDARDQEISDWARAAANQEKALAEAQAIHEQQNAELERLNSALTTRRGRDRRRLVEVGVESEQALRSELERLRSRAREQSELIQRLQLQLAGGGMNVNQTSEPLSDAEVSALRRQNAEQAEDIERLTHELAGAEVGGGGDAALRRRIGELTAKLVEQESELEHLRDTLARAQTQDDAPSIAGESKSGLKSRLEMMESQLQRESRTSQRLKAELAAANERAARQSAYYTEELKRFGGRVVRPGNRQSASVEAAKPSRAANASHAAASGVRLVDTMGDASKAPTLAKTSDDAARPGTETAKEQTSSAPDHSSDAAAAGDASSRLLDRLKTYEKT